MGCFIDEAEKDGRLFMLVGPEAMMACWDSNILHRCSLPNKTLENNYKLFWFVEASNDKTKRY